MAQLRCENISVGYEDGIVVSDVSFELNRGDYVCMERERAVSLREYLDLRRYREESLNMVMG